MPAPHTDELRNKCIEWLQGEWVIGDPRTDKDDTDTVNSLLRFVQSQRAAVWRDVTTEIDNRTTYIQGTGQGVLMALGDWCEECAAKEEA